MDRDLPQQEIRKKRTRLWAYAALAALVLLSAAWLMRRTLSPALQRSEIRTAVAETGDVENTLTATGEVQPEFEQVVTSPISAVLQQVYFNTGATIKTGEKILELDKVTTSIELEKQRDELELKRNGIVKTRLELDKSFYDIKIQDSIKACRITSLNADLENAKRLFKAGGGTREDIEQAETNLRIAQLEKRQLENDIRSRQAVMRAGIRESEITASIQEKALSEFERKMRQADIVASRAGVLTFVNSSLGARVAEGEILARIADLRSFKILGSITDNYASQLQVGMPVIARINDTNVRGILLNIRPSVTNNVVNFDVALDNQEAAQLLRPRMKVELYLVTDAHARVVRVANGPAFKGGSVQDVFVLRTDGKAERRTVKIGLINFDYVEITEGLQAGETVILSDMSAYRNAKEVEINP
ncbi:MAG TPA: HlyD family efflux transporter periplasmic adaptor subunit [Saprospiraceae bacterium]|nr:HlyD family efflux transporter periplasmic adaptor subunit [Saprospiraceae bacterium]HPI06684.1 HlyD family efflux transporter periplasmic adaptor subunit [Saprospiraceae bacterium]